MAITSVVADIGLEFGFETGLIVLSGNCLFWPKFVCHGNVAWTLAIRNVLMGLVDR